MNKLGNFIVGSLSALGVAKAIPDVAQSTVEVSPDVINSIEALVSLVSGILSVLIISWIKRKFEKKPQVKK